jgi:subtilisin family serine protease
MVHSKLDASLAARAHSERRLARTEELPERVRVLVHVTGDLRAVQEAGLWLESEPGPVVTGTIAVQDLAQVAALPDVTYIGSNKTRYPRLNKSVPAMHGDTARAIPPGFSGKGVVVGIVDSGIDIFHGTFRDPATGQTRILKLLDMTQTHKIEMTSSVAGASWGLDWEPPPLPDAKTDAPSGPPGVAGPLPVTATSAQVQAALLQKFPSIHAADIQVTGGPLPGTPIVIDFVGDYAPNKYDTGKIQSFVPRTNSAGTVIKITRGREFVPEEINLGLSLPIQPYLSRDINGHGTHVAGIAAGNGSKAGAVEGGFCHGANRYVGVAPKADLIIVRTTFQDADNKRGVEYIFDEAAKLGKAAVVNVSFGNNTGPHDGTDPLETALDDMLAASTKRAIVIAAGNDGAKMDPDHPVRSSGSGVHTRKTVPAHTPANKPLEIPVKIVVPPGHDEMADRKPDVLDIWYQGPGQLEVELVAPLGAGTFQRIGVTPDTPADPDTDPDPVTRNVAGHDVTIVNADNVPRNNKKNINIVIEPRAGGTIATGEWTVRLWEVQGTATSFDCWIDVTDPDIHPRFKLDDQVITGTIGPPATAKLPIAVGAYNPDDHQVHETSARGPTTELPLSSVKPELCAPGIDITSALNRGETSGGSWCECCYDFYVTKEGTSQAAPHVAGLVALMFEMNPNLDHVAIKRHLTGSCDRPDPDPHGSNGDDGYGFGLVNAEKAMKSVKAELPHTVDVPDEPLVLSPAAYHFSAKRARKLLARVALNPTGQLVAALVSEHVDEVRRLINDNRRVLVAWHRMHGPDLLRLLLSDLDRAAPLPARLNGRPVADGLARFLDALAREGSPELRAMVAEHRDLLLTLPGAEFPPAPPASPARPATQGGPADPARPAAPAFPAPDAKAS